MKNCYVHKQNIAFLLLDYYRNVNFVVAALCVDVCVYSLFAFFKHFISAPYLVCMPRSFNKSGHKRHKSVESSFNSLYFTSKEQKWYKDISKFFSPSLVPECLIFIYESF